MTLGMARGSGVTGTTKETKSLQLTTVKINHRGVKKEVKTSFISDKSALRLADSLKKLSEAIVVVNNKIII